MSEFLKVSGKKLAIPSDLKSQWKFTQRPGGWWIAESDTGERQKLAWFEAKGQVSFSLGGRLLSGQWIQAERHTSGGSEAQSDSDLVAQFPGKVRKVLVQVGNEIQEGDPMILVEAMKMEFVVRAPYSAKIIQILVKEGQQLTPGDRFIELKGTQGGK